MDGYIRVSDVARREGVSYGSPALQEKAIRAAAGRTGVTVGEIVVEEDVSGAKRANERGLGELLDRCERGESDGLIVSNVDRLSRGSLLETAEIYDRLDRCRARLIVANEGIDTASTGAELTLNIMAALARANWRRYQANYASARERAIERGAYPTKTPYGYRRIEDDGLIVPNPETKPVVRRIFHLRGEGLGIAEIARLLEGVPSPTGGPSWSHSTIAQVHRNRVYLGEAKHGEFSKEDAHEAIVSAAEFSAAQVSKALNHEARGHSAGVLSAGIARCAGCGHTLKTVTGYGGALRLYCKGPYVSGPCPARCLVRVDEIDPYVEGWFLNAVKDNVRVASAVRANERASEAQRLLDEAQEQKDAFVEIGDAMDAADFQRGYDARRGKVELLKLEVAAATAEVRQYGDLPSGDLLAAWPDLSIKRRRQLLAAFVDSINVSKGTGPVAERIQFVRDGVVVAPDQTRTEVLAENR